MTIKLSKDDHQLLTLTISGKYLFSEFQQLSEEVGLIFQSKTKLNLLVIFDQFEGWEDCEQWSDTAVEELAASFVRKTAVVAEKRWHDDIEMFGLMDFQQWPFKFFNPEKLKDAYLWLEG